MKKLLPALAVFGLVYGYTQYRAASHPPELSPALEAELVENLAVERRSPFSCDGRKHCSQMTSCEEAVYFIRNCPGTRMDGDNDGVPCEDQWCRR